MDSVDSKAAQALGNTIAKLMIIPTQLATSLVTQAANRLSPGCEIPPPCWEPKHAGTCTVELAPGNKALVRVHMMNCGWTRQVVTITALGKLAGWMSFSPTTLILDPQERATLTVTVQVPTWAKAGERLSGPIIVRGCGDHYVRVEIVVSDCNGTSVCDVMIDDCPDHIHHWYDHFYCPRPCRNGRVPGTVGVKDG